MIELRFFRERYKTVPNYYTGDKDIYCRLYFQTLEELKEKWNQIMKAEGHYLEGETYSAWYIANNEDCRCDRVCLYGGAFDPGDVCLCGGAFDPGDIEYISEEYKKAVKNA